MATNNALSDSPVAVFSTLISLVDSINRSLAKYNVFISNLIKSTDNRKTNVECVKKYDTLLKGSNYHVLHNSNIKKKTLEDVVFI